MDTIPVYKPLIEDEEFDAARKSLELGWLGMGSFVGKFEAALLEFLNAADRFIAAVSTGHAALHLGLLIAGVGPGDEVITPSFNNIADFQAILATGAEPVLCDIDDKNLCIDLERAERLISRRTKALLAMDYACMLCDHDGISELAQKYDLRVVHDAAHAFGSSYGDRKVGSFSDICMFSFDPVKSITCIDGGVILTRSEEERDIIREMRLIGMGQPSSVMYQNQRAWTFDVSRLGFRYHMANMHAAIGLAQLAKMEDITKTRREACCYYSERLAGLPEVKVPNTDFSSVTPFLFYIRVPEHARGPLREHMRQRGIDSGIHWQPGHWFTLLKDCRKDDLAVTERVGREILSLPTHSRMTREEMERVAESVASFFEGG
jgi:dTDP-4-amino-4,6-dideoxygalactose transaminase